MKALSPTKIILIAFLALAVSGVGALYLSMTRENAHVQVMVPELSALAQVGATRFKANCARCHGVNAAGSNQGPPLVHDIYNPGHHGDASFRAAPKRGVRAHHWPFGNMPPIPGVTDDHMTAIIAYVRELQMANGIVSHPMDMSKAPMGMSKKMMMK